MPEDSPSLEKTRFQFNRLFSRLDALAEICNIHLEEGWLSLDTPLGSIKVSPNGDARTDSTTWDNMKELFFESDLVVDSGSSLDELVGKFQLALYHQTSRDGPLYEPAAMKEFTAKHAPGLFEMLLSVISRDDSSIMTTRNCKNKE